MADYTGAAIIIIIIIFIIVAFIIWLIIRNITPIPVSAKPPIPDPSSAPTTAPSAAPPIISPTAISVVIPPIAPSTTVPPIVTSVTIPFRTILPVANNEFGIYSSPIVGKCVPANSFCREKGQRTITRRCIPHPITRKGCIDPKGQQTYEDLINIVECQPICRSSIWNDLTPEVPCIVKDDQEQDVSKSICVPGGTLGVRTKVLECTRNDDLGNNFCTNQEIDTIVGTTGQSGLHQRTIIYQIGDTIKMNIDCVDFSNEICGEWQLSFPIGTSNPGMIQPGSYQDNELEEVPQDCTFNRYLTPSLGCIVSDVTTSPFDTLKEGYLLVTLGCVLRDGDMIRNIINEVIIPSSISPSLSTCEQLDPPVCNDQAIQPSDINNITLPDPFNANSCINSDNNNTNNPVCIWGCRLFPGLPLSGSSYNQIVNKLLILQIPEVGYISPSEIPTNNTGKISRSDQDLNDVSLEVIPFEYRSNLPGCTPEQIEFDTSIMITIGPRELVSSLTSTRRKSTNIKRRSKPRQSFQGINESRSSEDLLIAQMMGIINGSYLGWISNQDDNIVWKQAYNFYDGPGINSTNQDASQFQIIIKSDLMTTLGKSEGKIIIGIMSLSGQSISVNSIDGRTLTLDTVEVLIFPFDIDLSSRNQRKCNLLLDP